MSAEGPLEAPRGAELLEHGRFLRGLARGLVGDPERAEDLLHDTFAAAIAHPARDASAPRAWLARILRRLAIKRGQREGERPAREAAAARERGDHDAADPPALLAEIELARRLLEAVARLREPYRGTLYLRYWRGLAPRLIAAEQRLALKTVKTRLARGLELLRSELDRRPGGRETWVALLLPLARRAAPLPFMDAPHSSPVPVPALALGAFLVVLGLGAAWFADGSPPAAPDHAAAPAPSVGAPEPRPPAGDTALGALREAARPSPRPAPAPARGVRLAGRVLDEDGQGLPGVEVRAVVLASERRRPFAWTAGWAGEASLPEELAEARTTSAAHGAFALELAGEGYARVAFERDGHAPRSRRLFVVHGQALVLDPLVLARGAALAGRVLDPAGVPVAQAELWLAREDEGLMVDGFGGGQRGGDGRWLVRAGVSDEEGRFALTRVAPGDLQLEVRAPGFAPGRATLSVPWPEAERGPFVLTLERGTRIAGTVLGLAPEELPRMRVLARPVGPGARALAPRVLLATLDAHGAFVLAGLAQDEELELVLVAAAGPGPRSEALRVLAGAAAVQLFALPPEGAVRPLAVARVASPAEDGAGTLVLVARSKDGAPVPGALVVHRGGAEQQPLEPSAVRATDGAGRLEWRGLAAGEHAFRVVSGAFGPDGGENDPWTACTLRAGEDAQLDLASPALADVRGVVRTAGRALSDARLWLRPALGSARAPAATLAARADAEGRFAFRGLAVGTYALEIVHPDRAQGERRELVLGTDGAELVVELSEARLAGHVRDEQGVAVAGASVRILPARRAPGFGPGPRAGGEVCTDAQGHFELVGVDPAQPLLLAIRAAGRATLQREVRWPADALELALLPEVPLALVFAGAQLSFLTLVAEGPRGERLDFGLPAQSETTLRGLGAGKWRLTLRAPRGGGPEDPLASLEVELVAGERRTLRWELP